MRVLAVCERDVTPHEIDEAKEALKKSLRKSQAAGYDAKTAFDELVKFPAVVKAEETYKSASGEEGKERVKTAYIMQHKCGDQGKKS